MPIAIDSALFIISLYKAWRFSSDIFLESFSPLISFFKITAAATTGPANAPLPTSSTPAINMEIKLIIKFMFTFKNIF